MILADKIISLRKKAGWSQEELAQKLDVSRQSVSKWEGAQSIPDISKILQMSRLFGVTTDFLLKDELEEAEYAPETAQPALRRVTMEQALRYLELRRQAAPRMALATFLSVLSPVPLLSFSEMSQSARFGITENAAAGLGLCAMLVLVAAAVALFLTCGARTKEFDFLDKEPFETEYGVSGMVRERQSAYAPQCARRRLLATMLCILSVLPLFAALCIGSEPVVMAAVCALLMIAGAGAALFVCVGVYEGAMERFGGGRLLARGEGARARAGRSLRLLLAGCDGGVPVLYLRAEWKRTAAVQLGDLGHRRRTLCGSAHRFAPVPETITRMPQQNIRQRSSRRHSPAAPYIIVPVFPGACSPEKRPVPPRTQGPRPAEKAPPRA